VEQEFELLRKYLEWWIDRLYITTLEKKIEILRKQGYIEYGRSPEQLPNFDTWKLIVK